VTAPPPPAGPAPGTDASPDGSPRAPGTAAEPGTAPAPAVPLRRNRDFRLLWVGLVGSEFGSHASILALPLLSLAVTGSPALSGLVLSAMAAAQMTAGLPAGLLVDRYNRKTVMLGCEAAQALAAGSLALALCWGRAVPAHLVAVAVVFGAAAAMFEPAEAAVLPSLVPDEQLAPALAANAARTSLGQLAGASAGGFLFAAGRLVPFLTDALCHTVALGALSGLRVPPRPAHDGPRPHPLRQITEGLHWVWDEPRVRATTLCAGVLNLFFSAFYLVVLVRVRAAGTPDGQIGVMAAMLGAGGLAGALAAPVLYRRLRPRGALLAVFWVLAALAPLAALTTGGYLTGALFAAMALFPPAANTAVMTEQLLRTPDALRGRLTSVLAMVCGAAATAGPALGGLLTQAVPAGYAVVGCAAGMAAAAVLATASPSLRRMSGAAPEAG
jgi:predicted MFS family arabinose efflux permease